MNYPALKTEIDADPAGLGLAAFVAVGNDQGIADALNAPLATITISSLTKNEFLRCTAGAAIRLAVGFGTDSLPIAAITVAKWKALLEHSYAADPGSAIDLSVIPLMGDPVADKVMTTDEHAAMTTRQGSRAESLWGQGSTVTQLDVATALRGNR